MKTNKTTRPHRQTRPTPLRPAPYTPRALRPGCELLDFCLYPGMKPTAAPSPYPTAV